MFEVDSAMFLLLQVSAKDRVLQAGKVILSNADEVTVEFGEPVTLVAGADMIAMGETNGRLFQQGIRVKEFNADGPKITAAFRRMGEIVSAEQRQMFRVSVATAGMEARIGNEKNCQVVDLSPEGFGAILDSELKVGSLVQVSIDYEGKTLFTASARVQTCKLRPDKTFRHGFLVPDAKSPARKAMQQLSSLLQRQQLRRLAGAV